MNKNLEKKLKNLRNKLKNKKPSIGGWLQISNSSLTEIMGEYSYDWLALDMEHGSYSIGDLPNIFRSIELKNKIPLVRLPNKRIEIISQILDAGSAGFIIPNIRTHQELNKIIKSSYLPPLGNRGVGFSRANMFGKNFINFRKSKTRPFIVAMVENLEAIKNLKKIVKTKGLDAILIGPYDLSASMKITGNFNHIKFLNAIKNIKIICKKAKIPFGIHVIEPNFKILKHYINEGFKFLPFSMDTVLINKAIKESFQKK
jgi:2-dehydro-3-deoxyglucarate aldolase